MTLDKVVPCTDTADELGTGKRKSSVTREKLKQTYGLSWYDLTYTVTARNKDGKTSKTLLHSVYGHCAPGEVLALMGPSGAGKSTLLDLLADRVSTGTKEGKIQIGMFDRDASSSRKLVSYVSQEHALLSCFTVRETLRYAARLALGSLAYEDREKRVNLAMVQMGLLEHADTRVGDALIKGLSGGQQRRLSIASELLQRSPVLILDEPTSGLDSASARKVVTLLRQLADDGHTVLLSIHQPSTSIYQLFSSLCIMVKGRPMYFGPTGDCAVEHFSALGHRCPEFTNPAEFFIDLSMDDPAVAEKLSLAYPDTPVGQQAKTNGKALQASDPKDYANGGRGAGPCGQFFILLLRILHMNLKNPYIYAVRIVMYIALSFMVGTMYLDVGKIAREDPGAAGAQAVQNLLPLLFYVHAFLVFMSVAVLPFFAEIRDVFRRERATGQITCAPYVVANFLAGLPALAVIAVISSILVVFLADLNGFPAFFLNLFLALVAAESLMHVIGAAQPHYIIGMAFGAGLFGMFMLCEGFMVPFDDIPAGWIWAYHINMHTYSFEWFMHNQFTGSDGGAFGEQILKRFDMDDVEPVRNALVLVGYSVIFEVLFLVVLQVFHTGRR